MERIKPRTLSGFMELLPAQQQQMERVMDILRTTYGRYGFTPLDTPIIEASEILLAKGGGETEKQIYRFSKGDSDLSLRFDLTVPLAKYVAQHYGELTFPFRRFQIGKVYRGERAQRGRGRECFQADIDGIGDGELDIMNDAEIPAIIYDVFSAMGLKRFQIRINNRRVLNGFYSMLGLTEQSGEIMRTVDKIEKIGSDMVRAILVDDVKLTGEQADEILKFIAITGTSDEVLAALKGYCGRDELFDRGYEELSTVIKYLGGFGVAQENFKVDLTIARGLDYYTGTVYETALLDYPQIGSVCSGGRYDNLASQGNKKYPGVGLSIGLSRLVSYMLHTAGAHANRVAPASVLVAVWNEADRSASNLIANQLRSRGIAADVAPTAAKLGKQLKYADQLGIPYVWFPADASAAGAQDEVMNIITGDQRPADAQSWEPDTVYAQQTVTVEA